jgi:hypothetical protein
MSDEEKANEYSRGRADEQTEVQEDIAALARFIERCMHDAEKMEKEYHGKREISNRTMRTYYGVKKAAFSEILERLKWEFPFAFEEASP